MEITTVYQKERHEFGRAVNTFNETDVTILDEFLQDSDMKSQHIERNPTILDIQAIPEMSETYVRSVELAMCSLGGGKDSKGSAKKLLCRHCSCCCCCWFDFSALAPPLPPGASCAATLQPSFESRNYTFTLMALSASRSCYR